MSNILLTGIGISNFKTINKYTFIPIKDITVFIGKNGSGKSSSWQVLKLFERFFLESHSFSEKDGEALGLEFLLDVKQLKEYGSINTLLFDETEPLVIELASKALVRDKLINNEELVFRFEFRTGDTEGELRLNEFKLFTNPERELLYEISYDNFDVSHITFSEYFGQYILQILYKLRQNEVVDLTRTDKENEFYNNEFFAEALEFLNLCPDSYFDYSFHHPKIKTKLTWDNAPFAVIFPESLEFEKVAEAEDENTIFPMLAGEVYKSLKRALSNIFKHTREIFFINRKLIGHPERFMNKTSQIESLFYNHVNDVTKDFISRALKIFGFKELPFVKEDESGDKYLIRQGEEDLVNSGSGYWALTFLLYGLMHVVSQNKKLLVLEEPEAHLHPDFQALLADLLIDAAKTFHITFLVETHSEYLTRRLQLRVFEAHNDTETDYNPLPGINKMLKYSNPYNIILNKEQVVINYFKHMQERNEGESICMPIYINETGMLSKEYPYAFAGVANADSKILFDLRNRL